MDDTSKHTPGPWRYDSKKHRIVAAGATEEVSIAELNKWEFDSEEYEANARLISAAPDLWLAALAALSLLAGSIEEEAKHFVTEDLMRACLRVEGKVE